ncbi:hypothetical protein GUITHDRAFT_142729 [Guillardia theta CCMP2712]|uniref:IPT/TIG domain-containing protein n=1 Tax=Guillardia theta (strain CCMP2712) TaxID=905079 RepID=L1IVX8_GUITC|nr:hypothetical protein GUITHDRAFT_142729 [Guillardia theta CCMP2712]EKX40408.1 hypothetical protein GUITHDRAFT_142729 [Guillardia theta CCMP2712]|eukprot:XP_005827388.1 hypothetical protein GUITHDRAFT_142729 [Guillardia theta CCMP2712]
MTPGSFTQSDVVQCYLPPVLQGLVSISVHIGNHHSQGLGFLVYEPMKVSAVLPSEGPTALKSMVTILGSHFLAEAGLACWFDQTPSSEPAQVLTSTSLTCVVPALQADGVQVTIRSMDDKVQGESVQYLLKQVPHIKNVQPTQSDSATDLITLIGEGFSGSLLQYCRFGYQHLRSRLTPLSASAVVCERPTKAVGNMSLTLESEDSSHKSMPYTIMFHSRESVMTAQPSMADVSGGTAVYVSGVFPPHASIECVFDQLRVKSSLISSTQVRCTAPPHDAGEVHLELLIGNKRSLVTSSFSFVDAGVPEISNVIPRRALSNKGGVVTIYGQNFLPGLSLCEVGGDSTAVMGDSRSMVTCNLSPQPQGKYELSIYTPAVDGFSNKILISYEAAPTVSGYVNGVLHSSITVIGSHFLSVEDLVCRLNASSSQSQPGQWLSSSLVKCSIPQRHEGPTTLSVSMSGLDECVGDVVFEAVPRSRAILITPTIGPLGGGTRVEVSASDFPQRGALCWFGQLAVEAEVVESDKAYCITRAVEYPGAVKFGIGQEREERDSLDLIFEFAMPPSISGIHPLQVPRVDNTIVEVEGVNFREDSMWLFSHQTGSITVFGRGFDYKSEYWCDFRHDEAHPQLAVWLTSTKLACLSPSQTPGEKLLYVSQDGGAMTSELVLEVIAAPEITDVVPSLGVTSVPTRLEVVGSGFQDGFLCCMGTTVLPSSVVSDSKIECTIPATAVPEDLTIGIGMEDTECTEHPSGQVRIMEACSLVSALPDVGSSSGRNESVILTGKGFVKEQDRECWFGAAKSTSLWLSSSLVTCELPPHPAGSVVISLSMQGVKYCESSFNFTYLGEASVQAIRPSAVYETGGTEVTLSGHFMHRVTFELLVGDHAMSCQVQDSDQATCVTPPKLKGVYRLRPSAHSMEINPACVVRYVGLPSVSSIHPTSGPSQGGTRLLLEGEDFEAEMLLCAFARVRVWAEVRSSTVCECVAPASSEGGGRTSLRLVIRDVDYIVGEQSYIYYEPPRIDEIKPSAARVGQEEKITILGRNLDRECGITLGSQRAEVSEYVSSTMVVVLVPGRARSAWQGNMTVGISRNGVDWDTHGFGYEWTSGFVVMRIEPSVGGVDGGDWIRVEGYGYAKEVVNINFGDRQARCNVTSEWEVSCLSPRGEAGQVSVYGEGSRETEGAWFVYHQRVRVEKIWPTSGSLEGGDTVMVFLQSGLIAGMDGFCKFCNVSVKAVLSRDRKVFMCRSPSHTPAVCYFGFFFQSQKKALSEDLVFEFFERPHIDFIKPLIVLKDISSSISVFGSGLSLKNLYIKAGLAPEEKLVVLSDDSGHFPIHRTITGNLSITILDDSFSPVYTAQISVIDQILLTSVSPQIWYHDTNSFLVTIIAKDLPQIAQTSSLSCKIGAYSSPLEQCGFELQGCRLPFLDEGSHTLSLFFSGIRVSKNELLIHRFVCRFDRIFLLNEENILVLGKFLVGQTYHCKFNSSYSLLAMMISSTSITCGSPSLIEINHFEIFSNDSVCSGENVTFMEPIPSIDQVAVDYISTPGKVLLEISGSNFLITNLSKCKVGSHIFGKDEIHQKSPILLSISTHTNILARNSSVTLSNDGKIFSRPFFLNENMHLIKNIFPSVGPSAGGVEINVLLDDQGWSFGGSAACEMNGIMTPGSFTQSDVVQCYLPPVLQGLVSISVHIGNHHSQGLGFLVYEPMKVSAVLPSEGPTALKSMVTILGSHFLAEAGLACWFDQTPSSEPAQVLTSTSLTCVVPALQADGVQVTIRSMDDKVQGESVQYLLKQVPHIKNVQPTQSDSATDLITLIGEGFSGSLLQYCRFGYQHLRSRLTPLSASAVVCERPTKAVGNMSLTLESEDSSHKSMPYTIMFHSRESVMTAQPSMADVSGGTAVYVSGVFPPHASIECVFDQLRVKSSLISSTQVRCTAPPHDAGEVHLELLIGNKRSLVTSSFSFVDAGVPEISNVIPRRALSNKGGVVTIYGQNFLPGLSLCEVGGDSTAVMGDSRSMVTCNLSPQPQGKYELSIYTPAVDGFSNKILISYEAAPTVSGYVNGVLHSSITVIGSHFLSVEDLVCRLNASSSQSQPGQWLSSSLVKCSIPQRHEGPTTLSVSMFGLDECVGDVVFEAVPRSRAILITPTIGPLGGGTRVEVSASDLPQRGALCWFGQLAVEAEVVESDKAYCITRAVEYPGAVKFGIGQEREERDSLDLIFEFAMPPSISGIHPLQVPRVDNTIVEVYSRLQGAIGVVIP